MMIKYLIVLFPVFLLLTNCSQKKGGEWVMSKELKNDLSSISKQRIYFGHQSVGGNIIQGIQDILSETGFTELKIIKAEEYNPDLESFFAESRIGQNYYPKKKCDSFRSTVEDVFKGNLDIAMMKFCYIDFNPSTDVKDLFEYYKKTIEELKATYPNITFVHITVPLSSKSQWLKSFLKKLLKGGDTNEIENIKRNEFNQLLKEYFKEDPIFDLAESEATYPDSSKEYFEKDGRRYSALIRDYTDDGGHLNSLGRKKVAQDLIKTLARIVKQIKKDGE